MNKLLYAYIGAECLGEEKTGFKVTTFRGTMTLATLAKVEEFPNKYTVKPYLKPLPKMAHKKLNVVTPIYARFNSIADNDTRGIRIFAAITNDLRAMGYDVDGLIDSGDALLHPDHDYSKLL